MAKMPPAVEMVLELMKDEPPLDLTSGVPGAKFELRTYPPKPSPGRCVLYVLPNGLRMSEVRPATIVRVNGEGSGQTTCNLVVLLDGPNDGSDTLGCSAWVGSVGYSEEPKPGTWHWPPRV